MNSISFRTVSAALTALALAVSVFAAFPLAKARAATNCGFTRDLAIGAVGEDVRCLQQYLNGAGYVVSTSGVGSPGSETTQFQAKTSAAVAKWQAANGLP